MSAVERGGGPGQRAPDGGGQSRLYRAMHTDVTRVLATSSFDRNLDKGSFVTWMSRHLDIPEHRIATFGDAGNDSAMFARSGLAVAMGNAEPAVQASAGHVAAGNDADGFADGVARFLLP